MSLTPKSPRPPARVLHTPSSSNSRRAPKRFDATPRRVEKERHNSPMTPRRVARTTPSSAVRNKSEATPPVRTPKRAAKPEASSRAVKKRLVGELAAKRVLPTVRQPSAIPKHKSTANKNIKDKTDASLRTESDGTFGQLKKRKLRPESDTKPATDASGTEIDGFRHVRISKKRQPKVKPTSLLREALPSQPRKKDLNTNKSEHLPQKTVNVGKRSSKSPAATKPAEGRRSEQRGEKNDSKSKKKKKRPTPGRFDFRLPDVDDESSSPEVVINEAMTESKLQLLQSSPLKRLIPEKDREAAAAEVAAQKIESARKEGKRSQGLNSNDRYVPLDPLADLTISGDSVKDAKLQAARKNEARKVKEKARNMRKRGELPEGEPEGLSNRAGVVYIGHIPHGFYEKEMRSYFSQFGEVTRLRLSRSKKTGRSRGFAFLEFADADVASIAAEAMDGYLMHGQALVAKVVPEDKVHPDTFKGADRKFRKIPWSSIERQKIIARAKDPLKLATRSRRVKKITKERMKSLSKKGIKYDYPQLST